MPDRQSSLPDSRAAIDWRAVALIAAMALAACVAGIGNDFTQDDGFLIRDNVLVHDPANLGRFFTLPFWPPPFSPDLYRPLTSLLLAIQWAFGSGEPTIFRVVSYLLYATSSVALFHLATRVLSREASLAVALLFAAHPVHVEAIALGVAQNELAVGILAVMMTMRYIDARRAGDLRLPDWLALCAMYAAACLFKEQGFVLPGLLLAAELFVVRPAGVAVSRNVVAGIVALAAIGGGLLLVRRAVLGDVGGTFVAEALAGIGAPQRALTMLQVVPRWLRLLVWPAHLQSDYSPQEIVASKGFGLMEIAGMATLLGAVVVAWLSRRRAPACAFGLAWCGIALLPVSNIILPTGILLAERTLFLPSMGALIAIGVGIDALRERFGASDRRRIALGILAALVLAGVLRSAERQRVWRNEAFLAVRTVQDAPRSFRAQRAYGDILFGAEQFPLALQAYDRAIALAPAGDTWRVRNDLARSLRLLGRRQEEVDQLRASLRQRPDQEEARGLLVAGQLALGRYADAAAEADTALARGGSATVFRGLRTVADSAARAGAPPGSINIGINTGPTERWR